ncbi:hypothetical protein chiPu_0023031, partial [Chiloscyllium punctatum]|nr:hypothetical protein [Chiloscyllium punctatum]
MGAGRSGNPEVVNRGFWEGKKFDLKARTSEVLTSVLQRAHREGIRKEWEPGNRQQRLLV